MSRLFAVAFTSACLASAALALGMGERLPAIATVRLEPLPFSHRLDGEWRRDGHDVDAPMATVAIPAPIEVMALPVSMAEYMQCVAAKACDAPDGPQDKGDLPVTGVNWLDATAYAAWLSTQTGESWRLPTDVEWAQAAGDLWRDDALGITGDPDNPAVRWLAEYEAETARSRDADREIRPVGQLNVNALGVHDIGGAVWEWTNTCLRRGELDAHGQILRQEESCGIYIAEGRHRAALTLFERNPRSGGCSVGLPPDNMGFRLVRDLPQGLLHRLGRALGI
jgi:formylglycine-generating enzyme required for sulfatase activity